MSWGLSKTGRASKMAASIKQLFIDAQGCPKGTAEEAAKNILGDVAETLCKSFNGDPAVSIKANGSAWNDSGKANSQYVTFTLETIGDFVE